ncbi:hypothetical protein TRVL_08465 [Trypanosoma vivax]|nr:hypothetical protein TRVL_08465 [Trypanosoma vivax]
MGSAEDFFYLALIAFVFAFSLCLSQLSCRCIVVHCSSAHSIWRYGSCKGRRRGRVTAMTPSFIFFRSEQVSRACVKNIEIPTLVRTAANAALTVSFLCTFRATTHRGRLLWSLVVHFPASCRTQWPTPLTLCLTL